MPGSARIPVVPSHLPGIEPNDWGLLFLAWFQRQLLSLGVTVTHFTALSPLQWVLLGLSCLLVISVFVIAICMAIRTILQLIQIEIRLMKQVCRGLSQLWGSRVKGKTAYKAQVGTKTINEWPTGRLTG